MSERLRIMLLLSSLHGGGAERVAIHLLNRCDPDRFDVRMGLLRRTGPYLPEADPTRVDASPFAQDWLAYEGHNSSFYRPDRALMAVTLAPLNAGAMIRAHRPHIVMSFLKGMSLLTWLTLGATPFGRPVWIAREGNNTDAVIDDELTSPLARAAIKGLTRRAYRRADCVLANSQEMARGLRERLGVDARRLRVIHNPVDGEAVRRRAAEPLPIEQNRPFLVTVGRLEHQKGHDLLIKAYAEAGLARSHDLVIVGRGTREAALRAQAAQMGVGEAVKFVGFAENPWAWVARSSLFVLPSRWEGFPCALVEALACGAPALATACEYGPAEVIDHGRSGWIAPPNDADALRRAMTELLASPDTLSAYAAAGPDRAALFGLDAMVGAYGDLFVEQARARRRAPRLAPVLAPEAAPS